MRMLRQLNGLIDQMPGWAQIAIAIFLVAYSLVSIYGRINVDFGAKIFSRVGKQDIRSNQAHIFQYTVVPVIVTIGYLALLLSK